MPKTIRDFDTPDSYLDAPEDDESRTGPDECGIDLDYEMMSAMGWAVATALAKEDKCN